ncbi:MAG: hypothetical protein M3P08_11095 [Thermoproteota archaeon]|nr:hypothetical protein [Thermoproteota archaeon]
MTNPIYLIQCGGYRITDFNTIIPNDRLFKEPSAKSVGIVKQVGKFGKYVDGCKYCSTCKLFVKTDSIFCVNCHKRYRTSPRVLKDKTTIPNRI